MAKRGDSYWSERAVRRMDSYLRDGEGTLSLLSKAYQRALRGMEADIENIFENYRKRHSLTPEQAKAYLENPISYSEYKELLGLVDGVTDPLKKRDMLAKINAPAYRYRMRREAALQVDIEARMAQLADAEIAADTKLFQETIQKAYGRTLFDIQKGTGLGVRVNAMSPGVVQEILRNPWSGALFSERVRENTSVLAEQLNEVLTDSITRGRSWAQTSRELADRMGMGYREAERVVRTESVYVANAAEIESYKAAGIEKYRFLATLDMKTSRVCQEHDGEIFDVDKAVPGENLPPLHPNCRSTTTAVFDDMDMAEFERVAMDPVTGESYMVPANMTYPEWLDMQKEKYGVDVIDAERKKVLREAADKKQYRKYWAVLGKKGEFSSFANFQNLKYNNGEGWAQIKQAFSSKLPLTDFDRMKPLQGQWSDAQVRKWYVAHDRQIDRLIDSGATLERQARQAYEFRNLHRTQARDLMKDQEARKILDEKERNMTFEMLMEYKKAKYGLTGDEAYRDIVRSAGATRKSVDEQYGVD